MPGIHPRCASQVTSPGKKGLRCGPFCCDHQMKTFVLQAVWPCPRLRDLERQCYVFRLEATAADPPPTSTNHDCLLLPAVTKTFILLHLKKGYVRLTGEAAKNSPGAWDEGPGGWRLGGCVLKRLCGLCGDLLVEYLWNLGQISREIFQDCTSNDCFKSHIPFPSSLWPLWLVECFQELTLSHPLLFQEARSIR